MDIHSFYLPRNRLYEHLDKHRQVKLMTVVSEPGYGKTTLISSYILERSLPAIWVQLRESDRFAHTFITHLQAALCKHMNLPESKPVLPETNQEELSGIIVRLNNWSGRLHIVFDDVQVIQPIKDILDIIESLLRETSPNITFIFIGQSLLSLPYAAYKVRRNYAAITNLELAFTQSEIADFFLGMNAAPLEDYEVELIYHKTEGWPASLELIRDAIQERDKEDRVRMWSRFPVIPHLYDYLASEVLDLQQPEIKRFLLKTSILRELDNVVIEQYLKSFKQDVPEYLTKRFMFIYKNKEGLFRYHKLFRSFLFEQYRKETSRSERDQDHRKLSVIYEQNFQFFHAFAHAILGRDFVNAGRLMKSLEIRYQPQQFIVLIENWLEEFFAYQSIASSIFLYRCIPLSILQNLVQPLEQSLANLESKQQYIWVAMVQQQLAGIYMLLGDLERAQQLFEAALLIFEQVQDRHMIMLNLNILADVLLNMNRIAEAKACAQRCLFLAESAGTEHFHLYALSGMADVLIEEGASQAVEYLDKAFEGGSRNDDTLNLFLYCGKSKFYSLNNESAAAIHWAQKAVAIAEEFGFVYDIGFANLHLARAYMRGGQWETAAHSLEKAYLASKSYKFHLTQVVAAQYELLLHKQASEAAQLKWLEMTELCQQNHYPWIMERYKQEQLQRKISIVEPDVLPLLSIEALGPLKIIFNQQPILIKRKASLRLLLFLLVNHSMRIPQDLLIEELFKDQALEAAQNQLYVALSVLRSTLEPGRESGRNSNYIGHTEGLYYLHIPRMNLDFITFLELCRESELNQDGIQELIRAEQCYKGDLLEEYRYEPFIEVERERIRLKYLQILNRLADYFAAQGDYYRSIEYYELLCAKDPYNQKNYQAYIDMLERFNMRSHALAVAERMRKGSVEWIE
ncbi:BTAD domain-containing putative transcriptional regulator [Paenibacillus monticola]|uniref:Bacterial transcriptional activator domain-containing protein n=1 Tax=Paenibacillus monticola TaxID=2666075 RepID=A0A7X2L4L0_9BACL|nr:BTAD domain-containing putative transcriptional regulator [Paenibacillus monticola]MRN56455.1 hypothetical protein [Paenibacillus monticola]